ncbi:MAG: hypothetical protein K2I37_03690 [Muribaculaceae bacterium]|nr:hypothetical protein [Muribaculaceae bacterium]
MKTKISIYASIALALCACSDEDFTLPNGIGEDGSLEITLAVPEMQTVATRANEDEVKNVTMLVLSGNTPTVKQIVTYDASSSDLTSLGNNQYSLSVSIDKSIRSASDLKFYFIANSPASADYTKEMTEAAVKALTYTAVVDDDDNMPMSGTATLTDMTSGNSVAVMRNAAKVTVNSGRVTDDDEIKIEETAYNFSVFNTASASSVVAGATKELVKPVATSPLPTTVESEEEQYVHPTDKEDAATKVRPFVVLRAPYMNTYYYYRVDFRNKDKNGNLQDLNLESNHEYKFVVTGISGAGSATVAEAAANPSPLVEAEIYDVAPRSYNIITDGTRELGVSHELVYRGDPNGTQDIFVKLYSPNESEYPEAKVEAWSKRENKDGLVSTTYKWLKLAEVEDVTDNAEYAGVASGVEAGTKGRLYRLQIQFDETPNPGTLEAMISVDWKGLNREVPVKWVREFKGSDLCDVKLTVNGYDASGNAYKYLNKEDYWEFLTGKVNGVTAEQNGGNIRNEGLHFPVMYGESGKLWTYEYEITYKDLFKGNAYDWKITTSGIDGLTVSQTSGTNKTGALTVTVTKAANDWDYTTGELLLELKAADATEYTKYPLTVYHTGFFHNHTANINDNANSTSSYRVGGEPDASRNWYYYEVLTDGAGNHWLDRNLGATASGLYIEATGGIAYKGKSEAAGGYYRAAEYKIGEAPEMYKGLCPPGFEIPREEIWNSVRNSSAFSTAQMGSYYNAALHCPNGMYIYFPKALYYAEGNKVGDSRAGYYWSSTKASGVEKDQIGNWLRCLQISGNVTTYINGQVQGRQGANGYAMSVRCVNKTPASTTIHNTTFNVEGATHVYLYSVNDDGSRNAVTTWPGKAICSASLAESGQQISFSYESPTTKAENFYVIFSYKDKSGKIHTVSRASDGHTLYSANQNPSNLDGWKVVGQESNTGSVTTATGGTWKVTNFTDDSKANVYFDGKPLYATATGKWVVYCWNVEGWDDVVLRYADSYNANYTVTGTKMHNYYPQLYAYEIPDDGSAERICFTKTSTDAAFQGPYISVNNISANSYYDNSGTGRNQILPSEVSELKSGMWRIATRAIWSGKNHYIYDWGGMDASEEGDATSKKMIPLMEGKYFYYDIYNNASGFLINCGAFNNGNQTKDLSGNGYQEGKLIQQWQTVEIQK